MSTTRCGGTFVIVPGPSCGATQQGLAASCPAAARDVMIRHVIPYHKTSQIFAKGRWIGRGLGSVYATEHRHRPLRFYANAMAMGELFISGREAECAAAGAAALAAMDAECGTGAEAAKEEDVVRTAAATEVMGRLAPIHQRDVICHTHHVHEFWALHLPLRIIAYDSALGVIAVDKPPGLAVHAIGRHSRNTAQWLLQRWVEWRRVVGEEGHEEGFEGLAVEHDCVHCATEEVEARLCDAIRRDGTAFEVIGPANRLDKATSGVVLFLTRRDTARVVCDSLAEKSAAAAGCEASGGGAWSPAGDVEKQYVALVHGRFPAVAGDAVARDAAINLSASTLGEGWIDVASEYAVGNRDAWQWTAAPDTEGGKRARSSLCLAHFDEQLNCSVVRCVPHTGRTHQLRVHLASLGHPIVGDVKYIAPVAPHFLDVGAALDSVADFDTRESPYFDPRCPQCRRETHRAHTAAGADAAFIESAPLIYLHAHRYIIPVAGGAGADHRRAVFSAPAPWWARGVKL